MGVYPPQKGCPQAARASASRLRQKTQIINLTVRTRHIIKVQTIKTADGNSITTGVPRAFQYLSRKIIIIALNLVLTQKPINPFPYSLILKIDLELLVIRSPPINHMKIAVKKSSEKIPTTP